MSLHETFHYHLVFTIILVLLRNTRCEHKAELHPCAANSLRSGWERYRSSSTYKCVRMPLISESLLPSFSSTTQVTTEYFCTVNAILKSFSSRLHGFGHFFQHMKSEHYHIVLSFAAVGREKNPTWFLFWETKELEGTDVAAKCGIVALGLLSFWLCYEKASYK